MKILNVAFVLLATIAVVSNDDDLSNKTKVFGFTKKIEGIQFCVSETNNYLKII